MSEVFYTSLSAQIAGATYHSHITLHTDHGFLTIQMYYDFVCICLYVVENSSGSYFTIFTCTQTTNIKIYGLFHFVNAFLLHLCTNTI